MPDCSRTSVLRRTLTYQAGLMNFFRLYLPLANSWQLFDNSESDRPRPVAAGEGAEVCVVKDDEIWGRLKEAYHG
jgi:hypothetical protein